MRKRKSYFDKISAHNRKLISDFIEEDKLNELAENTIRLEKSLLSKSAYEMDKSFEDVQKEDIKKLIRNLNMGHSSKQILQVILKKFYRWLNNLDKKDPLPKCIAWMKTLTQRQIQKQKKSKPKNHIIISRSEVETIINTASNLRDKAIFEVLYHLGPRAGELVKMNLGHVKEKHPPEIYIPLEKTTDRWIPVDFYPEHLMRWYHNHPLKDKKDAPLFISLIHDERYFHKRISTASIRYTLKKIIKITNLNQNITLHSFRHTAISNDFAKGVPQTFITHKYGWKKNSRMIDVYDHCGLEQFRKYILEKQKIDKPPSYDNLKQENNLLERRYKNKISSLEEKLQKMDEKMAHMSEAMESKYYQQLKQDNASERIFSIQVESLDGEILTEEIHVPAPNLSSDELINQYQLFSENVSQVKQDMIKNHEYAELLEYSKGVDQLL